MDKDADRLPRDPTREEILEACERIRASWPTKTRRLRYQFSRARITVPAYTTSHSEQQLVCRPSASS